MRRGPSIAAVALALVACASPPARGQPAPGIGRVAPNIYEVAPEQVPAQEAQEPPFIEVSGSASVEIPVDQAQVSFAMETRAATADEASAQNAEAMTRVLAAIRATGIEGLEVETFGYSLQPQYATDSLRVRSIASYVAHNMVRATIDDVEAVGQLIDAAIAAGANRVAGVSFQASDPEPARAEALAEAVRNARAQAEAIAEALGRALGPPLEVRGGAERPGPQPIAFERAMAVQAPSTPIEAGEQTVFANVTIRFALGGEGGAR
ncbi:MAG TPA: SIMPL domain-containing protein [Longimicrobiales bacterium]|nr:SIMPL domain-containing protein [Longimicrobiales bacterium]